MVEAIGEARKFVLKTLRGVVDGNTEVYSSDFDVPDHPATVVAVEVVNSNQVIVVNGIRSDAARELAYPTFPFRQKKAVVPGYVGGIVLC